MFTSEGEVRDEAVRDEKRREEETKVAGQPAAAPPKPSAPIAVVPEAPLEAAKAPAEEPPADEPKPSRGFQMLINFIAQNAAMLLGAYADPRTGQAMLDLEGAREMIDMLDALVEATRGGNLAPDDQRVLLDVVGSLKLSYMEMTKAAAKAMQEKAKARP
jgi:hypothetical protein